MDSLLTLLLSLIVLPALGGATLGIASAVWQTATAESTPKWQRYLWFLGAGYVLLNLPHFLGALAIGSGQ